MKMHIKSILALLLSLTFTFSFFPSTISADELPNKIEEVLTLFELDDRTDVHSFNEVGVDSSRASNGNFNDRVYESSRNERLVFDSQGNLKSLSRTHLMTNQSNEIVQSFTTINSFDSIIANLISADYIPGDFYLSNYHKYYDDLWVLIFSKQEANGVNNPYNIVKIGFDAVTAEVLFFNRINDFVGTIDPIISEDQAIELAQKYLSEIGLSANVANYSELTIVRTSDFTFETDFRLDEYISVYKVFLTNEEGCVWVDSASGNLLLIEQPEIYDARAFYTYDRPTVYDDRYRKTRADNYNDIMSFLGYSSSAKYVPPKSSSRTEILNFIKGDHSWGFTISCHGSPNTLASATVNGDKFTIYRSDIQGIWSFVVLDACSTATNDDWANAFGIYDFNTYGRSFIGWNEVVLTSKCLNFSKYFKQAIKAYPNNTMLANVYKAIELIPDNDTYWVRYVGDRTTTGHK